MLRQISTIFPGKSKAMHECDVIIKELQNIEKERDYLKQDGQSHPVNFLIRMVFVLIRMTNPLWQNRHSQVSKKVFLQGQWEQCELDQEANRDNNTQSHKTTNYNTKGRKILGLILTKLKDEYACPTMLAPLGLSDHVTVKVSISSKSKTSIKTETLVKRNACRQDMLFGRSSVINR